MVLSVLVSILNPNHIYLPLLLTVYCYTCSDFVFIAYVKVFITTMFDDVLVRSTMFLFSLFFWCPCMAINVSVQLFKIKNQNAPRPSEHPPVRGGGMSKRLGGIKGCKYKPSSWHMNGFPDGNNIGSTAV